MLRKSSGNPSWMRHNHLTTRSAITVVSASVNSMPNASANAAALAPVCRRSVDCPAPLSRVRRVNAPPRHHM